MSLSVMWLEMALTLSRVTAASKPEALGRGSLEKISLYQISYFSLDFLASGGVLSF